MFEKVTKNMRDKKHSIKFNNQFNTVYYHFLNKVA